MNKRLACCLRGATRNRYQIRWAGCQAGFTLLEMVVAIGIFAIIAAISYAALNNFLDARAHINAENDAVRRLQNAFVLLEQDLRYAVNRPVRNEYGDVEPAFVGSPGQALAEGERLRLTTVRPAPVGLDAHRLSRVAWRLENGELSRVTWRVLDRDIDSEELRRRVMTNVQAIEFAFISIDSDGRIRSDDEWIGDSTLPAGVEVTVLMEDQPAYQRVFQVAGGS